MNEEFEKWYKADYTLEERMTNPSLRLDLRIAYLAGAAAMREKCVDVAEEYRDAGCITSVSGNNIAAAIRYIEVEWYD